MRIAVIVQGGLVQAVLADEQAEVLIVDYDVDGSDDDLANVPQDDGSTRPANVYRDDPDVDAPTIALLYQCRPSR